MKKLALSMAVVAMAGVASASLLIPDGDFSYADHSATWTSDSGGGAGVTFAYPTTGGNSGGYATMDATAGSWGVLVSPVTPGTAGGGVPISHFQGFVTPGATSTFTIDLITLSGAAAGGLKVEAWRANNTLAGYIPDVMAPSASATWQTLQFDWLVPADAAKLVFVPIWGNASKIGFDNVGVVPEPATLGLIGLAGGAMVLFRRRFKI